MIPWIIALVLSFAAGSFAPPHPSDEEGDASEVAMLIQAGEDAHLSGRLSTTPVKLPIIAWAVVGLPRPVACLRHVEHGGGHWLRQFAHSLEHGRAPPAPAAI